jgi:hypothetical protein
MSSSIGGMDTDLRTALIVEADTISRHCNLVRGLKSKFKHTIRCIERPGDGTCATYALSLLETYRLLVMELQDFGIRPGSKFMR